MNNLQELFIYIKDKEKSQNSPILQESNISKDQLKAIVVQGSRNEVKLFVLKGSEVSG